VTDADPFAALAALAREEHQLVVDGRWEELAGLDARRAAILAALPPATPPAALPHLQEAARLQALVSVALEGARDEAHAELKRLDRTRAGVQGYGYGTPARVPAFDTTG
jgi:hypothetical protein